MTKAEYITDYLRWQASVRSHKPAFVCDDRTLTWSELWQLVEATAARLAPELSATKQEPVGLLLPNSWQFVISYLAILHAGHIAVPLDPSYKKLEIDSIIDQIKPRFTITDEQHKDLFAPAHPVYLAHNIVSGPVTKGPPTDTSFLRLPPDQQIASLLFTSGTTGKPKTAPYTHANHIWNIVVVKDLWKWTCEDTILLSLPLSHWHGLVMGLTGALYHGCTVYLQERFNARATLEVLSTGNVSLFMHVPIAYWLLVNYETDKAYDLSAVRLCISGSSYLPPAVWQAFKSQYGHEILERYGASETGLVASNLLTERQPGSVGKLLPGVEVKLQPDGELAMRSPGLFPGYYANDGATKAKFTKDGFWLTGDIGDFDPDGRLVLKGRIQEKIKKFGYTIYPRDVEWSLLKNPAVKDAVVLGLQDQTQLSDTIAYFIVGDTDEASITAYCKQHMPAAWRPDVIVFIDEIPKTRSGKPQLPQLKALLPRQYQSKA